LPFFKPNFLCPRPCQSQAVCSRGPAGSRGLALPLCLRREHSGPSGWVLGAIPTPLDPPRAEQTNVPGASVDRFCCGRLGCGPGRWPASCTCGSTAVGMARGVGVCGGQPAGVGHVRVGGSVGRCSVCARSSTASATATSHPDRSEQIVVLESSYVRPTAADPAARGSIRSATGTDAGKMCLKNDPPPGMTPTLEGLVPRDLSEWVGAVTGVSSRADTSDPSYCRNPW
jgi:hypothetical protein